MAVDLNKYPTQTGTGTGGSSRISHNYPTLVNSDGTQTEGAKLNDDSICFATSNNKNRVAPMCEKTYIEFGFNVDVGALDVHTFINKRVSSNYGLAGAMMFKTNSTRSGRVSYTGSENDPMNDVYMENLYSYGNSGNVSNTNNNISFCTGFSWWQTYGVIYLILAEYDNANSVFITRPGESQPTKHVVSLADYNTTYSSNPNYKVIGAFLYIENGNNAFKCAPWCGYKSPIINVSAMINPGSTTSTQYRKITISDNTPLYIYSFGSGYAPTPGQSSYIQASINGCPTTAPLVDPCMCSGVMRYRNVSEYYACLFGWYSLGAIRGGSDCYRLNEYNFQRVDSTEVRNGFITEVIVSKIINSACTYGILISDRRFNMASTTDINTKTKLRTWATSGNGQYIYVPIPEKDGSYAGKYRTLLDFIDNSSKDESPYYPKSDGDLVSMLNNPDLSFDHSAGGGGGNVTPSTDETPLNNVQLNTVGVFNRSFAVSQNDLYNLADYIYNADDNIAEAVIKGVKFMGDTPSNALVSLALTPFDLPTFVGGGTLEYIKLGRQTTTVAGLALSSNTQSIVDFGDIYIPYPHEQYGVEGYCFLDGEPYTAMTLYIPYIGMIDLSPKEVINKRMNVKLIIDWATGTCCGCVFIDGVLSTYKIGTINTQVSMTAVDSSVNISGIIGGLLSTATGVGSTVVGGSMGNPFAMVGGVSSTLGGIASTFDSMIPQTNYKTAGSTTSGTAMYLPPYPYLIVTTVKPTPPENYASSVGYACNTSGYVGSFDGFTVCEGFKSNCARTSIENDMINQLMNTGVIV